MHSETKDEQKKTFSLKKNEEKQTTTTVELLFCRPLKYSTIYEIDTQDASKDFDEMKIRVTALLLLRILFILLLILSWLPILAFEVIFFFSSFRFELVPRE